MEVVVNLLIDVWLHPKVFPAFDSIGVNGYLVISLARDRRWVDDIALE